jgi:hypothetical protein
MQHRWRDIKNNAFTPRHIKTMQLQRVLLVCGQKNTKIRIFKNIRYI